jgi:hypothetical protein
VYLITHWLLPADGFWINDNGCKFIQLQGLIRTDYQRFDVPWSGRELDPELTFNPLAEPFGHVVNGRLYAQYTPIFACLSSFPYRWLGNQGLFLLPMLGGVLTIAAAWRLAQRLSRSRAAPPLSAIVVGLATPVWFYSHTFWEITSAVCLTTWSVVLVLDYLNRRNVKRLLGAALCCSGAVYFRDELYALAAILTALVFFYGGRSWRRGILFVAVITVALVPLWLFQWRFLDRPLGHHFSAYSPIAAGWMAHVAERWKVFRNLFINSHESLWLSLVLSAPYIALFVTGFRFRERVLRWLVPLGAGLAAIGALIILEGHQSAERPAWWLLSSSSLFAVSPILILACVRAKRDEGDAGEGPQYQQNARNRTVVWLTALLYAAAYAMFAPERNTWGIHWGCRFLMPVYPLLGVLASVTLAEWWGTSPDRRFFRKTLLTGVVGLSVLMQIYSVCLLYQRKLFSADLNRVVASQPEPVIVAQGWFVPQELSHTFYDKPAFMIRSTQQIEPLLAMLRRAGYERALFVAATPTPSEERAGCLILADTLGFLYFEIRSIELVPSSRGKPPRQINETGTE